jgi:hypothetical protein
MFLAKVDNKIIFVTISSLSFPSTYFFHKLTNCKQQSVAEWVWTSDTKETMTDTLLFSVIASILALSQYTPSSSSAYFEVFLCNNRQSHIILKASNAASGKSLRNKRVLYLATCLYFTNDLPFI